MTKTNEKKSLIIASSPHFRSNDSSTKVMLRVIIALMPLVIAVAYIFGSRVFISLAISIATAVVSEFIIQKMMKRKQTIKDLSAVVTAMILVLNLPIDFPFWQLILGTMFAIVVVKAAFGGIGQNFANPAITARIVMVSSFTSSFMGASDPLERAMRFSKSPVDAIVSATANASASASATASASADAGSSATILSQFEPGADFQGIISIRDMLFGLHPTQAVGETCIIAIIIGGLFLLVTKTIKWHTPVSFIGTVAILSFIHGGFDPMYVLYQLLGGGLIFGAFFMATDYATTPVTSKGKAIFGIGLGLITCLIRFYGNLPEGVSFAILTMNILTPHIDKWTKTKYFGSKKALGIKEENKAKA